MPALKIALLGGYAGDGLLSINRYQRELARELGALNGSSGSIEVTPFTPNPAAWVNRWSSTGPIGARMASYWTRFVVYPRQLPRSDDAIYHLLDQSLSYLVKWLDPARTVVTCHDILHFPLWRERRRTSPLPWFSDRLYRFCVGGIPKCAAVVADSNNTKGDLVRYLGCDPNRIKVVYGGISPEFFQPMNPERLADIRLQLNLPDGFVLLHVGATSFYKNIEGLLQAFALLRRRVRFPVTLVRAGSVFTRAQRLLAARLGVTGSVREIGIQNDEMLVQLNHLADCFVFPSLYEGFGFPPLEAMACGTPVVASNRGSLPEILGEAALLVDPGKPEEIAEALRRILEEKDLKARLREQGLQRAHSFPWDRTARELAAVYRGIS